MKNLIFIDETGATRNLSRHFARSFKGTRAYAKRSLERGVRINTIGALGFNGLETALCFEGTLNHHLFAFFVEHFLVPCLQPNHIVVFDNATSHQDEKALELIEETGAKVLFLPPYAPELNPIELIWSSVKAWLKTVVIPDTEALYSEICYALNQVTSTQAQHCFSHCLRLTLS